MQRLMRKFVEKKLTKGKTEKGEKKAAAGGKAFTAIAIPTIDAFQTKGEIKAEKAGQKAYAKLVKKIDKKNAKLEKSALRRVNLSFRSPHRLRTRWRQGRRTRAARSL